MAAKSFITNQWSWRPVASCTDDGERFLAVRDRTRHPPPVTIDVVFHWLAMESISALFGPRLRRRFSPRPFRPVRLPRNGRASQFLWREKLQRRVLRQLPEVVVDRTQFVTAGNRLRRDQTNDAGRVKTASQAGVLQPRRGNILGRCRVQDGERARQ